MCGIAAIFNFSPSRRISDSVARMIETVRHRGPDDEGYVIIQAEPARAQAFGGSVTPAEVYRSAYRSAPARPLPLSPLQADVALGHTRLSIIDLSPGGHQPMASFDGRYWIVFNGEIYNYVELRTELEQKDAVFHSRSDTEVILEAYRMWGRECLDLFNGMFAFILVDCAEKKVFAARDRFGIKPLYMWRSPENLFAFASEIKQFTALPGWRAILNGQRAYDFLTWGLLDHTEECLFRGVLQMAAGHFIECPWSELADALPAKKWYALAPKSAAGNLPEAASAFYDLLVDSINLRLRSDVPVGSCLSGGLDSSSIVVAVNRLLRDKGNAHQQMTFSACSSIARYDERRYIDVVVAETGVDARYVYPAPESLFEQIDTLVWHQDEPFCTTSIFAQWEVFRLAAQTGVKVMLDGQGADEQLAGYHGFFVALLAGLAASYRWATLVKEARAIAELHAYSYATVLGWILSVLLPEGVCRFMAESTGGVSSRPRWLNVEQLDADPVNPLRALGAKATSVRGYTLSQLFSTSLPMLLHWEDRDSMAHSVESRVPFLDYRLVEYLAAIPDEFKLSRGVTKVILRDAMKGALPEAIRTRMDKMAFDTPEEVWIREVAPEKFRQGLREAVDSSSGVLTDRVMDDLAAILACRKPYDPSIWRQYCFGRWMDRFAVRLN